ncbi:Proliferating cell nuclear antigen [Diplonema papillatum]|nr:Proliferating cell nuclear antigen [Diplonema papillatum]
MFHAEIRPAKVFKQIVESLKEVVNECTFECSQQQMQVQAMDSSLISLVSLELTADQFHSYRCEKDLPLGVNVGSLSKVMKCANADDSVTLSAEADGDVLHIRLANPAEERVMDFSMKLMEIDTASLGIPKQKYKAGVQLPSSDFAKICRDIGNFGDSVTIEVTSNSVAFSASSDLGTGKVLLKAQKSLDQVGELEPKPEKEEVVVVKEEGKKAKEGVLVVKEEGKKVKREMPEEKFSPDDDSKPKKRKVGEKAEKPAANEGVRVECTEPVTLQFPLRYLTMFSKAQAVSDTVRMKLAMNVPLQVEFEINAANDSADGEKHKFGYLRYYLAPKLDNAGDEAPPADDDEDME